MVFTACVPPPTGLFDTKLLSQLSVPSLKEGQAAQGPNSIKIKGWDSHQQQQVGLSRSSTVVRKEKKKWCPVQSSS